MMSEFEDVTHAEYNEFAGRVMEEAGIWGIPVRVEAHRLSSESLAPYRSTLEARYMDNWIVLGEEENPLDPSNREIRKCRKDEMAWIMLQAKIARGL